MYEFKYIEDSKAKLDFLSEPIHFNKMPKPYTEISMEEYFSGLDSWALNYKDFHQVMGEDAKALGYEGKMVVVHTSYNGEEGFARLTIPGTNRYRFFRLGCKHDWELIGSDSLTNKYKCKKCGTVIEVSNGR